MNHSLVASKRFSAVSAIGAVALFLLTWFSVEPARAGLVYTIEARGQASQFLPIRKDSFTGTDPNPARTAISVVQ